MTWGDQLLHLGWTEQDLFGVNPRVLGSVVRDWGLALLINGGRVVSVSKSVAEIDRPSGAQTVLHPPARDGRCRYLGN